MILIVNVILAGGLAQNTYSPMIAYSSEPTNVIGSSPLAQSTTGVWQAVISVGQSKYNYPFFLFREKSNSRIDIVFFNEAGVGYYVETRVIASNETNQTLLIERRGGGGDSGLWTLSETLSISKLDLNNVIVQVNGEETTTRLFFFKRKTTWNIRFQFQATIVDGKLLNNARLIETAIIKGD